MIEPKSYEIKERNEVTQEQLINNGFFNFVSCFKYRRTLYKNIIFLTLWIDKEDWSMIIDVSDSNGLYIPFYNPEVRHDNLVYEDVVRNYNYFMDKLVDKNILNKKDTNEMENGTMKENTQNIKIKYFTDIEKIEMKDGGDLIDLRSAEDIKMKKGDFKLIPLGVAMQLPQGYKANVYPRSSTYKNFGIIMANSVGQIDESYCGDSDQWMFPAIAMRDTVIHKNDRICQFEIVKKQPPIFFEVVDKLNNKNRGGIGSTGKQ